LHYFPFGIRRHMPAFRGQFARIYGIPVV
jgi:hypothetical protein